MNKAKQKGTRAETQVVRYLATMGISAERKAPAGSKDQGDIEYVTPHYGDVGVLEVKAGQQTANPSRSQLEEWLRQAEAEAENSGKPCYLVVVRYRRKIQDADVWRAYDGHDLHHWYLDEWCEETKAL